MKELFTNLFSQIGHKLTLMLLVGTTAVTTGTAVIKLATKPGRTEAAGSASVKPEATPGAGILDETPEEEIVYIDPAATPSSKVTPTKTALGRPANSSANLQLVGGDDDGDDDGLDEENNEREDSENEDRYIQNEESHEIDD